MCVEKLDRRWVVKQHHPDDKENEVRELKHCGENPAAGRRVNSSREEHDAHDHDVQGHQLSAQQGTHINEIEKTYQHYEPGDRKADKGYAPREDRLDCVGEKWYQEERDRSACLTSTTSYDVHGYPSAPRGLTNRA